jgi:phage portal protein BeeE
VSQIVQHQSLIERARLWLTETLTRTLRPADVGAGYAGHPIEPGYDQEVALSAYGAFPYVFAAIQAVATDLAGLPLVARSGDGQGAPTTTDHPLIRMLSRKPSRAMTGTRFRRQITADFWAARNAYMLWTGSELHRLHPDHVDVIADANGIPIRYKHGEKTYTPDQVWHIADIGWSAGPDCVYGESPIRALEQDLKVEQSARKRANDQAVRGDPQPRGAVPVGGDLGARRFLHRRRRPRDPAVDHRA